MLFKNGTGNMVTMALEGISQTEKLFTIDFDKKMMNMMIIPWIILAFCFYTRYSFRRNIADCFFPIIIIFL